ncbi:MAG: Hsp20/alpha crystallin family protein [Candidatus Nitrosotenuis sp.]
MRIRWFDTEFSHLPLLHFDYDMEQKTLSPLSCLKEHDSKWILEFDLPLVNKKDIQVYIDSDGMLVVEAKLKEKYTDFRGGTQYQFEYFRKSMTLPKNVETKKLSAQFADGILTIIMPKRFEGSPVKIE